MGTVVSIGFVADLFYLDLIGRFSCKATSKSYPQPFAAAIGKKRFT
jgi:hypothetical protein